jgi:hypothetical protein
MKTTIGALCATAALAAATAANAATVIDFNEFTRDAGEMQLASRFESQGFTFELDIEAANAWVIYGKNDGRNADHGHATLNSNLLNTSTRMTRTDKGAFDLMSIDLADFWDQGQTAWVKFSFTDVLGTTTSEYRQLDARKGLETFALNRTNLRAFDYAFAWNYTPGSAGWGQADNITVAAVAAPEPGAWALMILGFGGVGATLRRRRTLALA